MVCVIDCAECLHRKPKIEGWIPACDAYPKGMPEDFDYNGLKQKKECNPENHIGFEAKK